MNSYIETSEAAKSREDSAERHLFDSQKVPRILTHTFDSVNSIDDFESYKGSVIQHNEGQTASPKAKRDNSTHNHHSKRVYVPQELLNEYKAQIEQLKNENMKLKETITKRTEEANTTILKLAKLKKQAEERN